MAEQKQPQPGEYWRTRGGEIRYIVGCRPASDNTNWPLVVVDGGGVCAEPYTAGGFFDEPHIPCDEDLVEHLPDCDGFDWVPEVWPKYFAAIIPSPGYYKITAGSCVYHAPCGRTQEQGPTGRKHILTDPNTWKEITEAEALSRLKPSPPYPEEGWRLIDKAVDVPQEGDEYWNERRKQWCLRSCGGIDPWTRSDIYRRRIEPPKCPDCGEILTEGHADVCPEAWVEITDPEHVLRTGVDQVYRSVACFDKPIGWETFVVSPRTLANMSSELTSARCRRKDLPPIDPPKPKMRQVVLLEWLCLSFTMWYTQWASDRPNGFAEVHPTGQTRTVEVPE